MLSLLCSSNLECFPLFNFEFEEESVFFVVSPDVTFFNFLSKSDTVLFDVLAIKSWAVVNSWLLYRSDLKNWANPRFFDGFTKFGFFWEFRAIILAVEFLDDCGVVVLIFRLDFFEVELWTFDNVFSETAPVIGISFFAISPALLSAKISFFYGQS